jgi:sugar phosphate isomerase/epimerase
MNNVFKYLRNLKNLPKSDIMKFGLSTIVYEGEFLDLAKRIKDLAKLYLRYIDLAVNFALKCNFKIIEVSGLYNNPHEILPPILGQIKEKIKPFDEISYHAPIRFISLEAMKKCILLGKKLGAKKIVLHPDFLPASPKVLPSHMRYSIGKPLDIIKLVSFCKKHNLVPCVENMPSEMPAYNKPEDFDYFVKKGAFLTVDIGHAATVGIDPVTFVERFGKKVRHVHLQDGLFGMPDEHYALGDGIVDYVKFIKKLKEIEFNDILILELVSKGDVIKSLNRIKNTSLARLISV